MSNQSSNEKITAYREAGHAVAVYCRMVSFKRIVLGKGRNCVEMCKGLIPPKNRITIAMASYFSVKRLMGGHMPSDKDDPHDWAYEDDYKNKAVGAVCELIATDTRKAKALHKKRFCPQFSGAF